MSLPPNDDELLDRARRVLRRSAALRQLSPEAAMVACDGCGKRDDARAGLPAGWTTVDYTVRAYLPYKIRVDFCPDCSKDTDAALARFQDQLDMESGRHRHAGADPQEHDGRNRCSG